ncbi:hypothetical protein [Fictibacillus barbaricus]|uniref:Uncharacterized protein n=1 Tax=Fictibacillus barbaricus TaxID=182136 RepID=A0ABS2Z7J4_9BACL|nr:hypothetical protein [Fictibacillus barbaricus]MBN3544000.1 hypothetical protein [Fictibacillus barbaricus]GGB70287.1 hypothetical protein GCM10007199_40630 [Fictibacillus barbaricus]
MTEINIDVMVERVTEKIYGKDPTLIERYGDKGRGKCIEDNHHHFKHLETAYELDNSKFFIDYALWLDGILQKFGMNTEHLMDNFSFIIDVLEDERVRLNGNPRIEIYIDYLNQANDVLSKKITAH